MTIATTQSAINGTPQNISTSVTINDNSTYTAPTGYYFAGWDTQSNNVGLGTARFNPGQSYTLSGNIILYAVYLGNPYILKMDPTAVFSEAAF